MRDDDGPIWDGFLGEMPDMTGLPMDWIQGEEHFLFDNGELWATVTVRDGAATIHDFYAHDAALAGGRTGIGRRALGLMRSHFDHLMAGGVGDPYDRDGESGQVDYTAQPAFLFWRGMLREGLVDEIDLMVCGTRITRDMLGSPIETRFGGTIEPDEADIAPSPKP